MALCKQQVIITYHQKVNAQKYSRNHNGRAIHFVISLYHCLLCRFTIACYFVISLLVISIYHCLLFRYIIACYFAMSLLVISLYHCLLFRYNIACYFAISLLTVKRYTITNMASLWSYILTINIVINDNISIFMSIHYLLKVIYFQFHIYSFEHVLYRIGNLIGGEVLLYHVW